MMTATSNQMIEDMKDAAGYGIGYWASKAVVDDGTYTITDEENQEHRLSNDKLMEALQKIADGKIQINKDLRSAAISAVVDPNDHGDIDSELADCIVQIACFGELVYG